MNHGQIVSWIWGVAGRVRAPFKRGKYQDVILPLTVLRRIDCVLAPTKAKVLDKVASLKGKGLENLDLPLHEGENYFVQRGRTRPVVVVGTGGQDVPGAVRGGGARWQTSPRMTVAPYYGTEQGWNPEFVRPIRHAEWPQYVWDQLPCSRDGQSSVLRLDQLFPVGKDDASGCRLTKSRLSEEGLAVLDEWLRWAILGVMDPEGALAGLRAILMESDGAAQTADSLTP
jgi:hypothetical protein